jgi:hypothetical protein
MNDKQWFDQAMEICREQVERLSNLSQRELYELARGQLTQAIRSGNWAYACKALAILGLCQVAAARSK